MQTTYVWLDRHLLKQPNIHCAHKLVTLLRLSTNVHATRMQFSPLPATQPAQKTASTAGHVVIKGLLHKPLNTLTASTVCVAHRKISLASLPMCTHCQCVTVVVASRHSTKMQQSVKLCWMSCRQLCCQDATRYKNQHPAARYCRKLPLALGAGAAMRSCQVASAQATADLLHHAASVTPGSSCPPYSYLR